MAAIPKGWIAGAVVLVGLIFVSLAAGGAAAEDIAETDPIEYSATTHAIDETTATNDSNTTNNSDQNGTAETVTVDGGVKVDTAVLEGDGEQTVIIEFESNPALAPTSADDRVEPETLKTHAEQSQAEFHEVAASSGGIEVKREFWITNVVVATIDTAEVSANQIAQIDQVTRIAEDTTFELDSAEREVNASVSNTTATPDFGPEWGLNAMNTKAVWTDFETKGEGASVAVLDTGVNASHPEIELDGWQEWNQYGQPIDTEPTDIEGHGTLSSGLITAGTDSAGNHIGVAPEAEFYHGRISSREDGLASGSQIIAGIEWAVENDIDIVSLSYGSNQTDSYYIDTLQHARQAGTLVISSSGNEGPGSSSSPGNEYDAFGIGASDSSGSIADFSSGTTLTTQDAWRNPPSYWPDTIVVPGAVAPGVYTRTTTMEGGYTNGYSGTSAAAPHAAGAAALLVSVADEPLEPFAIRDRLQETAQDLGAPDNRQGAGEIDIHAATLQQSREHAAPTLNTTTASAGVKNSFEVTVDHPVTAYTWAFPNRIVTTDTNVVRHTFKTTGTVPVTVTFEDTGGETFSETFELDVDAPAPTAAITTDASEPVEVGEDTVTLDASNSTDPNEIVEYHWAINGVDTETTTSPTTDIIFNEIGTQTASVTVVNEYNVTETATLTIDVEDTQPPAAALQTDQTETPLVNESVVFNASTTTDNHAIETYQFAFDDGTIINSSTPTVTHSYETNGTYDVTLTAIDESGNADTTTRTVTVSKPTLSVTTPTARFVGTERVTVGYTLTETATDRVADAQYRIRNTTTETVVHNWTTAPFVATAEPTAVSFETPALETGNYSIEVQLVDADDTPLPTAATTDSVDVAVRTTPPGLNITTQRADPRFEAVSTNNSVTTTVAVDSETAIHNTTRLTLTNETETITEWNLSAPIGAGENGTVTWNGTHDQTPVASGEYTLTATTRDIFANTNQQTETLTVDTTPPTANLSLRGGTVTNGTRYLNDSTPLTLNLTAETDDGGPHLPPAANVTLTSTTSGDRFEVPLRQAGDQWTGTVTGSMLDRGGTYTVAGTVYDAGKNTGTATTEFEYNSAPHLIAFTPQNGSTLDAGTETVNITAKYEDVLSTVNTSAATIAVNNETISHENLSVLSSEAMALNEYRVSDGTVYTVELYLEDESGIGETYTQQFTVSEPQSSGGGGGGGQQLQQSEDPAVFTIRSSSSSATEVQAGEAISIAAEIENTGERGAQQIQLVLNETQQATDTVLLDSRETTTVTFEDITVGGPAGEYPYQVVTDDDTAEGTITVRADDGPVTATPDTNTSENDTAATDPNTTEANETQETQPESEPPETTGEIPVFGMSVAIVSLLLVAGLLYQRS